MTKEEKERWSGRRENKKERMKMREWEEWEKVTKKRMREDNQEDKVRRR